MVDRFRRCHLLDVEVGSNHIPYWLRHQKVVLLTDEQPSNCRLTPTRSRGLQYRPERKRQRQKKALAQNNGVSGDCSQAAGDHEPGNARERTPQRVSHSTMNPRVRYIWICGVGNNLLASYRRQCRHPRPLGPHGHRK